MTKITHQVLFQADDNNACIAYWNKKGEILVDIIGTGNSIPLNSMYLKKGKKDRVIEYMGKYGEDDVKA